MIFCILCSVPFVIPLLIFFPDIFLASKDEFSKHIASEPTFALLSQFAILCGTLLATYQVIYNNDKKSFADYNLVINYKHLLTGFFIGAIFFLVIIVIMKVTGIVYFSRGLISSNVITGLLLYLLVAIVEEIVVRGYILNVLRQKMNTYLAIFYSSIIFGAIHLTNDHFTSIGFVNISLAGFLLGLMLVKTGTICAPIGLHWSWNFIQGSIAGFNVSGNKEIGVFIVKSQASDFLTGGDFGAEGSIIMIPISIISIYLVWKYYRPTKVINLKKN